MAFTVETPFFLPYSKSSTWPYIIHGTGTQADAFNALGAVAAPVNLLGSSLQEIQITDYIGAFGGEDYYKGVAIYAPSADTESPTETPGEGPGTEDPGWKIVGFELGVNSETVTQSNQHIARFPSTAHNYNGAIGVTDSGIQGASKWVRTLSFTLQKRLRLSKITDAWIRDKLEPLHLHYNNATWRGYPAGEVLFHSASGTVDGRDIVITGNFFHEKNISNQTVSGIANVSKKGWEWSWTKHREIETAGKREVKPYAVYIEQLYDPGNFSLLGA